MLNGSPKRGKLAKCGRLRAQQTWRGHGTVVETLHHDSPAAPVLTTQQRWQRLALTFKRLYFCVVDHHAKVIGVDTRAITVDSRREGFAHSSVQNAKDVSVTAKVRLESRGVGDIFVHHPL